MSATATATSTSRTPILGLSLPSAAIDSHIHPAGRGLAVADDPQTPTRANSNDESIPRLAVLHDITDMAALSESENGEAIQAQDADIDAVTAAALALTPRQPSALQVGDAARRNLNHPPSPSLPVDSAFSSAHHAYHSNDDDETHAHNDSAGDRSTGSANRSEVSSPDVDLDRPLAGPKSVALQRGDSTSSDSSVSGLSRASSSSSVYATPFRMTPFRTPAPPMSRTGSYINNAPLPSGGTSSDNRNPYFPPMPARYVGRGGAAAMASNRSSFSGSFGSARAAHHAAVVAARDGATAHDVAMHALGAEAGPSTLPLQPPLPRKSPAIKTSRLPPVTVIASDGSRRPSPRGMSINLPAMVLGADGLPNMPKAPPSPGADLLLLPPIGGPGSLGGRHLAPVGGGGGAVGGGGKGATGSGPMSRTNSATSLSGAAHKRANDFELGTILGEGSYSTVFLATDRSPPFKQYALKVLDKKHIIKERKVKYVNVEKDTLARLDKHPGVVRLYWTFHDERSLYFVLELARNGEILSYLKELGSLHVDVARFYAAQLVAVIEYMHKRGVVHRDIKPENILLDENMRIKMTDFGTAKLLPTSPTNESGPSTASEEPTTRSNSFVGTAQYVCPELLTAKPVKTASKEGQDDYRAPPVHAADMWAFGCVLYQFICGRTPFRASNEYLIFQKITKLDYDFPPDFPDDAKDLVQKLLVLDPFERLGVRGGVEAVKQHPFFESVDWPNIWTCEVPAMRTGITPPTVFPTQLLALEEVSMSSDGLDDDEDDGLSAEADIDSSAADVSDSRPTLARGVSSASRRRGRLSDPTARKSGESGRPPLLHTPSAHWPPGDPRHAEMSEQNTAKQSVSETLTSIPFPLINTEPTASRRSESPAASPGSSRRKDLPFWPSSARSTRSFRSSASSTHQGPASATSAGSMQRQQESFLTSITTQSSAGSSVNGVSNGAGQSGNGEYHHTRSRSGSSNRWSKILSVPKTAFQRVKTSAKKAAA